MSKYTVTYFNIKALGEPIRLLLANGNEDFKDVRIEKEQWPNLKESTPFGQLPTLEFDGKVYAQCTPICRYLGKLQGLAGANLLEDLEIDQNVEVIHDLRAKAAIAHYEADEQIKAKKYEEFSKTIFPVLLSKIEEIASKNNGHIALGKLTWGDFLLTGLFDYLKSMLRIPDFDTKYPNIKKIVDNVRAIPQVKKFIDNSPKSDI